MTENVKECAERDRYIMAMDINRGGLLSEHTEKVLTRLKNEDRLYLERLCDSAIEKGYSVGSILSGVLSLVLTDTEIEYEIINNFNDAGATA